jgi:GT2 family glycosyltransferase
MSSPRPTVSVVVATLRRPHLLRHTLRTLVRTTPPPDEILVVDGDDEHSARAPADEVRAIAGPIPIHYVEGPQGLTRQRNVGVTRATGDVVVFVDDDVALEPDAFARVREAYADPGVVGVTAQIVEPETRSFGRFRSPIRRLLGREGTFTRFGYPRYPLQVERETDIEFMFGCFMSGRRDAVVEVGFDEGLPGYALAEDQDFSFRLSRRGRLRYVPQIVCYHRRQGFDNRDRRAFDRNLVATRAYLMRKNFQPNALAWAEFTLFVSALLAHRLLNREYEGARGLVEGMARIVRR